MAKATCVFSTPPTSTPIADDPIPAATETHRTPLRDWLFAIAIVFMMISGGVASSLLAQSLEARLAHRCAVAQKAVLR